MRASWFPLRVITEESLLVLSPGLANCHSLAASSHRLPSASASLESVLCVQSASLESVLCVQSASLESVLCVQSPFSYKDTSQIRLRSTLTPSLAAQAQEGLEELFHVQGQEGWQ